MTAMLGMGALTLSAAFVMVVTKAPLDTEIERGSEEPRGIGITRRIGVAIVVTVIAIGRPGVAGGRPVSRASGEREADHQRCRH